MAFRNIELKPGLPPVLELPKAHKRTIIFDKDIVFKDKWYKGFNGIEMIVYMFPGFSDVLSANPMIKDYGPISSEHFSIKKYAGSENDDARYRLMMN
jgi:hypothetical protein